MIQGVTPSLYISPYNPLRFVEQTPYARCRDLNPNTTLYHHYNQQPQTEVQPYAQPYSYADRLVTHFYSRYNANRLRLVSVCDNAIIDTFELTPIPNQNIYTTTSSVPGAVQITNNTSITQNTYIGLGTQILNGIAVNGSPNAWNSGIGKSLIGGKVLITAPGKFLEAAIVDYQSQNFDWLELDRVIDLSSWSDINVTFVSRKRADLAYYHESRIDLCNYPKGCYKLILESEGLDGFDNSTYEKSELQVSRTIESEQFSLKIDQPGTNLIKYKNYKSEVGSQEIDWQHFGTLDFFELRVHSQFLPTESNSQKNNIFRSSGNIQIISDQSATRRHRFNVDFIPWYMHQKLTAAFNCDQIKVNSLDVIALEGYKPSELLRIGKSTGSIVLSQQNNFMENLS